MVGFGTIPSCLQRWDAATGGLIWTQTLPSGTSFGTFNDSPAIWGPSLIAIPSGSDLMVVDRNTGAQVQVLEGAQEQLVPIGFIGETLDDMESLNSWGVGGLFKLPIYGGFKVGGWIGQAWDGSDNSWGLAFGSQF